MSYSGMGVAPVIATSQGFARPSAPSRGFAIWRQGPKGYAPPWRPSGFHSFQGLGRYVERPGFHYEYATAGLGATGGPTVTLDVRTLQRVLIQKGFNVGSTGADGTWGTRTLSAISSALGVEAGYEFRNVSGERGSQTVQAPEALWRQLNAMPDRPPGTGTGAGGRSREPAKTTTTTTRPSTTIGPSTLPDENGYESSGMDWGQAWPYAAGAAGLLALGGFFLWQGRRKRAVAANRRRRRRRRRSRRRR